MIPRTSVKTSKTSRVPHRNNTENIYEDLQDQKGLPQKWYRKHLWRPRGSCATVPWFFLWKAMSMLPNCSRLEATPSHTWPVKCHVLHSTEIMHQYGKPQQTGYHEAVSMPVQPSDGTLPHSVDYFTAVLFVQIQKSMKNQVVQLPSQHVLMHYNSQLTAVVKSQINAHHVLHVHQLKGCHGAVAMWINWNRAAQRASGWLEAT